MFTATRVARDNGTDEGMFEARSEAFAIRMVVVQIFMQLCCHHMLNG
jgi:hypothetical protein